MESQTDVQQDSPQQRSQGATTRGTSYPQTAQQPFANEQDVANGMDHGTDAKHTRVAVGAKGDQASLASDLAKLDALNANEIQAGQLGQQHALDHEVKTYAATLEQDHQKADQEVRDLAQRHGVALDPHAASAQKKEGMEHMKTLEGKTGGDFDRSFVKMMVKDHQKTIDELGRMRAQTQSEDLRAWLDRTLPVLQGHLSTANDLNHELASPMRQGRHPY